jgi:hypothetical protein
METDFSNVQGDDLILRVTFIAVVVDYDHICCLNLLAFGAQDVWGIVEGLLILESFQVQSCVWHIPTTS